MKFTIPIQPITKKNHGQIIKIKNRMMIIPSKQYREYEKKCEQYIPHLEKPINYKINLKCSYFMGTKRRTDLTNLLQATCDVLVKYKIIEDDNYSIISSVDGSSVSYDKENPRTIIEITKKEE